MQWKIKLQVASILIRFVWCHFNWWYIFHRSDEIIWTWFVFRVFPQISSQTWSCLKERNYLYISTATETGVMWNQLWFFALIVCKPHRAAAPDRESVSSPKFYCSAPCAIQFKNGWAGDGSGEKKKEFYILTSNFLHLIVSLHNDMRGKPVCLYCD